MHLHRGHPHHRVFHGGTPAPGAEEPTVRADQHLAGLPHGVRSAGEEGKETENAQNHQNDQGETELQLGGEERLPDKFKE